MPLARTSKPDHITEIARDNPLTRGLILSVALNRPTPTVTDDARKGDFDLDGASWQSDIGGRTVTHTGTTDGILSDTDGEYSVSDTNRFTWAYWVKMANDNNCYIGGRGIPSVPGYQYLFQWYANDFYFSTGSTGTDYDYLVSGFTLRSDEYQLLVGTYDGADLHMYVSDSQGLQDLGTSNIGSITIHNPAGSRLVLGGRYDGSGGITYGCNCDSKAAFLWDRALDPREVLEFCKNPWAVYSPVDEQPPWVESVAGQITTRTLSDSIDANDSPDPNRYRNKKVLDSLDFSDLLDYSNIRARGLIDSFSLQDTIARNAIKARALLDAIDTNDSLVSYSTLARVLADNADITDSIISNIISSGIITKILSDSINLQDLRLKTLAKIRSDSFDVVDLIVSEYITTGVISRALLDSIDLADLKYKKEIKARLDQVDLQDAKALYIEKARVIFDSLDALDDINKIITKGRLVSDNINLLDSVVTMFLLRRILTEYMEISDSIDPSVVYSGAGPILTFVLTAIRDELNVQTDMIDQLNIETGIQ